MVAESPLDGPIASRLTKMQPTVSTSSPPHLSAHVIVRTREHVWLWSVLLLKSLNRAKAVPACTCRLRGQCLSPVHLYSGTSLANCAGARTAVMPQHMQPACPLLNSIAIDMCKHMVGHMRSSGIRLHARAAGLIARHVDCRLETRHSRGPSVLPNMRTVSTAVDRILSCAVTCEGSATHLLLGHVC
jgi:hypothetical protein